MPCLQTTTTRQNHRTAQLSTDNVTASLEPMPAYMAPNRSVRLHPIASCSPHCLASAHAPRSRVHPTASRFHGLASTPRSRVCPIASCPPSRIHPPSRVCPIVSPPPHYFAPAPLSPIPTTTTMTMMSSSPDDDDQHRHIINGDPFTPPPRQQR